MHEKIMQSIYIENKNVEVKLKIFKNIKMYKFRTLNIK